MTVFLVYTVISPKFSDKCVGANRVDPDQTAPLGLHLVLFCLHLSEEFIVKFLCSYMRVSITNV